MIISLNFYFLIDPDNIPFDNLQSFVMEHDVDVERMAILYL